MRRYLVSCVINGTFNFFCSFENVQGPMNEAAFAELQTRLRKKHGKKLVVMSFSKFEGSKLPVVDGITVKR